MEQAVEQATIKTDGLKEHSKNIILGPNPTGLSLMTLEREELRKALGINDVRVLTVWRKPRLAQRLAAFIRERREAEGAGAQAGQVNQAPQPVEGILLCLICLNRRSEWVFCNCMHVGACSPCKDNLLAQNSGGILLPQMRKFACPMCRVDHTVHQIKKFYMV